MLIEEALVYHLEHGNVGAIVGDRIWHGRRKRSGLPSVTYIKVSDTRGPAHDGPQGFTRGRFQFDLWSRDELVLKQLEQALRLDLDCYAGLMGDEPGVQVGSAFHDNGTDHGYDDADEVFRHRADYFVYHHEAVAA